MKSKLPNIILLIGVLMFAAGAITFVLRYLKPPALYSIPAVGLMMIAVGAGGRRRI